MKWVNAMIDIYCAHFCRNWFRCVVGATVLFVPMWWAICEWVGVAQLVLLLLVYLGTHWMIRARRWNRGQRW